MLKQVEQCYGVHNIAGSNPIAAITLLPAIIKQHKIAASNVKAEQCCGIAPVLRGWEAREVYRVQCLAVAINRGGSVRQKDTTVKFP